ncbi:putative transmembrane channel-like protein 7 isoform X3 [Penaeus vannamei]|uniref:Putative transmembrane channel-like protein 7 isoform X3 n=1 Tax=Penaeus vannamei TaxID=6689 RepID=A0A3R7MFV8_PENVA|nr:putative transmembrane channel-like protein 7 isoform X3 [Penaeus vannamei]
MSDDPRLVAGKDGNTFEKLDASESAVRPFDSGNGIQQNPENKNKRTHQKIDTVEYSDTHCGRAFVIRRNVNKESHAPATVTRFDFDHEKPQHHKGMLYRRVRNSRRSTKEEMDVHTDWDRLREVEEPLASRKLRRSQLRSHKIRRSGVRRLRVALLVLRKRAYVARQIVDLLKVWRPLVRKVDSRFGASGVAVFNFILDLLLLNFLLSILTLACVVLPTVFLQESEGTGSKEWLFGWQDKRGGYPETNSTAVGAEDDGETGDVCVDVRLRSDDPTVTNCSLAYLATTGGDWCHITVRNHSATSCDGFTWWLAVLIQGQGILEISPLFLGYYPARLTRFGYPVATMQVLVVLTVFLVSLMTVIRRVGGWLRYNADVWGGLAFSRTVFSGWNFSLKSSRAVASMQHIMKTELLAALDEASFQEVKARRTRGRLALLYFGRFLVNCVIFAMIIVNWVVLYVVIVRRAAWAEWVETLNETWSYISLRFIVDFADTLVVWVQGLVLPPILLKLGALEQCSSRTALLLYILRSSVIRLASLAVLVFTHLSLVSSRADDCRPDTPCWETRLAQNLYAQVVWSFVVKCLSALLCLAYTIAVKLCCFCCATSLLPEFDVPNKVLDILFLQTLCWLGVPVSPLMPVLVLLYFIVSFGLELVDALVISRPSAHVFQASRSSSMGLRVAWSALTSAVCDLNGSLRDVLFALDDLWVSLALAGALTCFATYYLLVLSFRKNVIRRLEDRLKEVAMDKAFFRKKREAWLENGRREEKGLKSVIYFKRNKTL